MKTQIKPQWHPQRYEDTYNLSLEKIGIEKIESALGSKEQLAKRFKDLYSEMHDFIFNFAVRQIWLEQHFVFCGKRRTKRHGNGMFADKAFSYFLRAVVGSSQKPMTMTFCFTAISTYMKDFFPDFLNHDPDKEPEYFKFPYKNITLDHLFFVYMMENRLELLDEAERRSMRFMEFANWAVNQAFVHNEQVDKVVYALANNRYFWPHIKNVGLKRGWADEKFKFDFSPSRKL